MRRHSFFNTIKEYKAFLNLCEEDDTAPFEYATLENLYKSCESYFWNNDRKDTLLSTCAAERIIALISRLEETGYEIEFGKISRTCIIARDCQIVDIKNFNYIGGFMINFTFKLKLFGCIAAILFFWIIALFYIWNTEGKIIFKILYSILSFILISMLFSLNL